MLSIIVLFIFALLAQTPQTHSAGNDTHSIRRLGIRTFEFDFHFVDEIFEAFHPLRFPTESAFQICLCRGRLRLELLEIGHAFIALFLGEGFGPFCILELLSKVINDSGGVVQLGLKGFDFGDVYCRVAL
jgi:hypothetical protein